MGTKDKLIDRFTSQPSDFTFDELEKLLKYFGYEKSNKGKTSGSRVVYKNADKRPIMIHKPHPGNIIKLYAMKQVLNDLVEAGFIKEK
ncbi:MAG: type II toxin-antitoxin system HicA family toxin [Parabacteroides gordonii]|nr:type II toxin-antitoxin system HicA family toxin [Parabacteroides gordonii]